MANTPIRENDLVEAAADWLRARVPESWTVDLRDREESSTDAHAGALEIRSPGVEATLAVEARRSLAPRDVAYLFGGFGRRLRALATDVPLLIVAPWMSARTRELLAAEDVNYIDLTGNALVRLESPALFIQAQGAERDPAPAPRGKAPQPPHTEPGIWGANNDCRGIGVGRPDDLIVPEGAANPGGRRGARLGVHGNRAARRAVGLEAVRSSITRR